MYVRHVRAGKCSFIYVVLLCGNTVQLSVACAGLVRESVIHRLLLEEAVLCKHHVIGIVNKRVIEYFPLLAFAYSYMTKSP